MIFDEEFFYNKTAKIFPVLYCDDQTVANLKNIWNENFPFSSISMQPRLYFGACESKAKGCYFHSQDECTLISFINLTLSMRGTDYLRLSIKVIPKSTYVY